MTHGNLSESLFYLFIWPHHVAWILVPWSGIAPAPLAVAARSLNHWTAKDIPRISYFGLIDLGSNTGFAIFQLDKPGPVQNLSELSFVFFEVRYHLSHWSWQPYEMTYVPLHSLCSIMSYLSFVFHCFDSLCLVTHKDKNRIFKRSSYEFFEFLNILDCV